MTDITFFLANLTGGGAEKAMLSIAAGFAEQGLKVDLVLVKYEGEYLSLISPKLRVIKLNAPKLMLSLPLLVNYLKQQQPKNLISALNDANIIGLCARYFAGVSTQVIVNIQTHISESSQKSNQLKGKLAPLLVRTFYPHADQIVAVSEGVATDAAQITGLSLEIIKVIYNPIFREDLLAKFDEPLHHPWFLSPQIPVILGVGRLEKQKDFPTLIRAFALVRSILPIRLIILGQGKELSNLQALVKTLNLQEYVDFPGFVTNPYAYMKKSQLFVLSSIFEGFGNVLVEAMLAGTPVISTDCESGPAEILAGGKYGNLVKIGDVEGLAKAIISTYKNPIESELLRQRGREFSLTTTLTQYQQILNIN